MGEYTIAAQQYNPFKRIAAPGLGGRAWSLRNGSAHPMDAAYALSHDSDLIP
jgi:hypothetical protein